MKKNILYLLVAIIVSIIVVIYRTKPYYVFWGIFVLLLDIIWFCNVNGDLLKDTSIAGTKPYSYSRVQMAWWTMIIISSFVSIYVVKRQLPEFNQGALILLGIGAGTTAVASMIDVTDRAKNISLSQDEPGVNMILDILTDKNGISISRLQTVTFNIVIGIWYIQQVNQNLAHFTVNLAPCIADYHRQIQTCTGAPDVIAKCQQGFFNMLITCKINAINAIMPVVTPNNLILLGVSAGTYTALKTNENTPSGGDNVRQVTIKLNSASSLSTLGAPPVVSLQPSAGGNKIQATANNGSNTDFTANNVPPGSYIINANCQVVVNGAQASLSGSITQNITAQTQYPIQITLK